ncbi:MAG: class I SAM-dependent methyltransferase [Eubacterium sp.]
MNNTSMTALMSLFARAHHQKYVYKILKDEIAERLITDAEYKTVSKSLIDGASFFSHNDMADLDTIMNSIISPTVIGRSKFAEKSLQLAVKLGTKQYMVLASGYDTSAYSINLDGVKAFEIDKEEMISDKISRLKNAEIDYSNVTFISADLTDGNLSNIMISNGFDKDKISFISALGIVYYLSKEDLQDLLLSIAKITQNGSTLVFDYPTEEYHSKIQALAKGAGEEMQSKYTYKELEGLLSDCGFAIYEHMSQQDINEQIFLPFNTVYKSNPIKAQPGVNYCLCVRK